MPFSSKPCSSTNTFCEHVEQYPTENVREALRMNTQFNALFGEDLIEEPMVKIDSTITVNRNAFDAVPAIVPASAPATAPLPIPTYYDSSSIKVDLCTSYTYLKYPRAAENSNGNWMLIVNGNSSERHRQGVRVEICS